MKTRLHLLFLAVLVFLFAGCSSDHGESVLSNYLYRLSNVLELEQPELGKPMVLEWRGVSRGESATEGSDSGTNASINLLEFLSLYGCELQGVIAEKNSPLGRLAQPSQALLRELDFIRAAPACLAMLESEGKAELKAQLEQAVQQKRELFLGQLWRVVLRETEARSFWRAQAQANDYPAEVSEQIPLALGQLEQLAADFSAPELTLEDSLLDSSQLESWLFQLNQGDGGQLYRALMHYQLGIEAANNMLVQAQQRACASPRSKEQRMRLENVVQKFFVDEVQAWAAQLSQRYYALIPPYQKLEAHFVELESEDYRTWRRERDASMRQALESAKRHVELIQAFLKGC